MSHATLPVLTADRPSRRAHPSKLFVEVTTRCNLRCAMCPKQAPGRPLVEGDMTEETFARLAPTLPHLDALVLNGIGEPLLHKGLEGFVTAAKEAMPSSGWVGFQTNGMLLDARRAQSLVDAGVDRVCVSADAVAPDLFRALRGGGKQEAVETAVSALRGAAREAKRDVAVGLEFVAMRSNLGQLPEVVRWAARNEIAFVLVTHMLPYDRCTASAAAFDVSSDRAVALFEEWRARAALDGVDLGRYFDVFMKFRPDAADQRVVEYVRRMVADASAQGVALSPERVLRADGAITGKVSEAFAEAEELARAAGLELKLPGTAPARERRCDFVEDGGAFVSWDGGVHPCYFLWHRYEVHAGGFKKSVRPKSFGSVADREALELWNDPDARSFRDAVVRYDYPYCYDCNVALCDYVETADFAHDCHVGSVPCGACLWSTGLFQCLR
ncbi:MAG: radical SAM/SPASM family putative metalloenzyme maturase [Anaeromyxobacteraceae bacterium]